MIPIPILYIKYTIISLLFIFGLCCLLCPKLKSKIIKEYYTYIIILFLTSIFVIWNWENCVNMQFFTQFNGYNIIFILWLFLIILSLFNVDFKGISSKMNYDKEAANQTKINNNLMKAFENATTINDTSTSILSQNSSENEGSQEGANV